MNSFIINEVTLEEALKVHPKIKEWDRPEVGTVEYCRRRIGDAKHLILGAYVEDEIIGYLIAYGMNDNFYCWLAAVDERYRRRGILTEMMKTFEKYAKEIGYDKVSLKTVNNKREMLSYLVKNNWNFTEIIKNYNIVLNEIVAVKEI